MLLKKCFLVGFAFAASFAASAQIDISDARNGAIGQSVTVRGVALNGSELGAIRYVQDGTGAIPAYGSSLSSVMRGDSVEVTGILYDYNGLLELSPTNSHQTFGATTLPTPNQIPITSAGESLEAQLLRLTNVTFTETGTFAGNTNYHVTDGTNTIQVRITTGTNLVGQAIPTGAVTVTGMLGQYNTDYQMLPRDMNDIVAYVAPMREINVKVGTTTYLTGSQYTIGTNSVTTLTIENLGTGNLTVSGATFSGAQASEYTTPFTNQVIGGGSTATLNIAFAPTGNGSRMAAIHIASDDADEADYVINLYGIGLDGVATQPAANPTNLTFPNVKAYTFTGSYTASANTEKYVVVWSDGAPLTGAPTDGVTYKRGDIIGNGKVAYIGSGTAFTPRHVIANQNYYVAVYAFNGPAGYENYRTASPLTGNVTSQGQQIGNYYSTISTGSTSFLTDLSALINPHTVISYSNYKTTVMTQFEIRDTTDGRSYVVCSYTGENKVFNDPFDWTAVGYSREHSYCHSWMPTYPADSPAKPEYSDQHNLYPVNQTNANSPRSNLPMNNITGSTVFNYMEGSVGYNGSQLCYEPRDAQKGNCARAMMYMATAYNGISGNNWGLGTNQPQDVIKEWHMFDMPDNYEIARNEYIYSVQGNRNPYVDSVNYACYVDFSNMTYIPTGCGLGIDEYLAANLSAFPVPTNDVLYVQVNGHNISSFRILDMSGKIVDSKSNIDVPVLVQNTSSFAKGTYTIVVETNVGATSTVFVKE